MHPSAVATEAYEGETTSIDAEETSRSSVDMADRAVNAGLYANAASADVTTMGFPDVSTGDDCGTDRSDISNIQYALLSPEAKAAGDALANGDYDAVNKMAPTAENALDATSQKEFAAHMKEKGLDVEYSQEKIGDKASGAMVIGKAGGTEAVRFKSTDFADGKKVEIEAVSRKLDGKGNASWVPMEDQNQVLMLLVGIEKRAGN